MSMKKARNPFNSIMREYECANKKLVVITPILLILIAVFVRWVSGSPITTLHYIGARNIVPPTWFMVLMFSISYTIVGLSLGLALGNRFCFGGEKKYQGAMWLVICLSLGYAWYPLFFSTRLFLVSIFTCVFCLFCSICATICFVSVSKLSFFLALAYDCWLLYLFFLNMQVFFAI